MKTFVVKDRYQPCHQDLIGPIGKQSIHAPGKSNIENRLADGRRNKREIMLMNRLLEEGTDISEEEWDKLCEKRAGKLLAIKEKEIANDSVRDSSGG